MTRYNGYMRYGQNNLKIGKNKMARKDKMNIHCDATTREDVDFLMEQGMNISGYFKMCIKKKAAEIKAQIEKETEV